MDTHPRGWAWAAEAALVLLAVGYVVWATPAPPLGDTLNSRLATAYSLVHHGTFTLNLPAPAAPNPFGAATVDLVEIDGRRLSTKPPLLPLVLTAEYAALHHFAGWDLRDAEQRPSVMRALAQSIALPSFALALAAFVWLLRALAVPLHARLAALAALGFGTQVAGFGPHFNNHVPAAAFMLLALVLALAAWRTGGRGALFGVGLCAALVFTIDLPLTIYPALAGLVLLVRWPAQALVWAGLGAAGPVLLQSGVLWWVTGSPFPVQLRPELYTFETSYWRNPLGLDALNEPPGLYLFHMTLGRFGMFALYPVLLLALPGLWAIARSGRRTWQAGAALMMVATLILFAYYVVGTNNYGGNAYGFRWGIGAMPILLAMAAAGFARWRRPGWWVAAVALFAVSAHSTWACLQSPWGAHHEWTAVLFGPAY